MTFTLHVEDGGGHAAAASWFWRITQGVASSLLWLLSGHAVGASPVSAPPVYPSDYLLEQVAVTVSKTQGQLRAIQRVELRGTGKGLTQTGTSIVRFDFTPKDLLPVITSFYEARFFDRPSDLLLRYSSYQKEDGSIGVSATRMHDSMVTELCFAVTTRGRPFEHCVAFDDVTGGEGQRQIVEGIMKISRTRLQRKER